MYSQAFAALNTYEPQKLSLKFLMLICEGVPNEFYKLSLMRIQMPIGAVRWT